MTFNLNTNIDSQFIYVLFLGLFLAVIWVSMFPSVNRKTKLLNEKSLLLEQNVENTVEHFENKYGK